MESAEFVRASLVNRTNADCSHQEVKNNRYHYYLRFDESIGFDWLESQITKLSKELDVSLERWEIHPSDVNNFEVEIREIQRREDIDDSQHGLDDF